MVNHFGDRIVRAIEAKGVAACVGLDPLLDRLPSKVLASCGINAEFDPRIRTASNAGKAANAILEFGQGVIRAISPHVPVIKINIAFFERYDAPGIRAYQQLVREAIEAGLIVIGDVKRGDIGHSSTQYAHAQLGTITDPRMGEVVTPDAVTVNPYFGYDGIRPFVELARETGGGLFVLVQTSNESAVEVQGLTLSDGTLLCERVAEIVQGWASDESLIGKSGYSCIGAVVSPRDPESTRRIRTLMPNCIFLVPGFGAQGRTKEEVAHCFKPDGTGALVTASRSVIYAFHEETYKDKCGDDWVRAVEIACRDLVQAVRGAIGN